MQAYHRLTAGERIEIYVLKKAGINQSAIATEVNVHKSTASAVTAAITGARHPLANRVHILTYDNGKAFAHHEKISQALDAKGFFAYPYHSWERGPNENGNGLIRQYTPKGKEIALMRDAQVQDIMDKLNNRPRKCSGFKTPNQVFFQKSSNVAPAS